MEEYSYTKPPPRVARSGPKRSIGYDIPLPLDFGFKLNVRGELIPVEVSLVEEKERCEVVEDGV